jgi:hypothetical protein
VPDDHNSRRTRSQATVPNRVNAFLKLAVCLVRLLVSHGSHFQKISIELL